MWYSQVLLTCAETCHSEERSDEESLIRLLAQAAFSGIPFGPASGRASSLRSSE
jgi:hypothetical protein